LLFTQYLLPFEIVSVLLLVGDGGCGSPQQKGPKGEMKVGLEHYLVVSALLFALGLLGVLIRRNLLIIYMSLELMLNAATLALVAASRFNGISMASVFVFFIITVAAAEVRGGSGLDRRALSKTSDRSCRGPDDAEALTDEPGFHTLGRSLRAAGCRGDHHPFYAVQPTSQAAAFPLPQSPPGFILSLVVVGYDRVVSGAFRVGLYVAPGRRSERATWFAPGCSEPADDGRGDGVAAVIHIYSWGYLRDDPGFARFFACLSLFTFSMLGIVLANNFIALFIFWELVGVSSYLLIGFWFERPAAPMPATKRSSPTVSEISVFFSAFLRCGPPPVRSSSASWRRR